MPVEFIYIGKNLMRCLLKRQASQKLPTSYSIPKFALTSVRDLTKFVKWEMEVALRLDLPIIGVNLNKARWRDNLCPPTVREELAVYVPFGQRIIGHAMDDWPASHAQYRREGKTGPYHYVDAVYQNLGIAA